MDACQYKSAFVIQFRPESDVAARRVEGEVEHIASSKQARFRPLKELLDFVATVPTDVGIAEQMRQDETTEDRQ